MSAEQDTRQCPHKDIRFCPLYVAMNGAEFAGLSCDGGQIEMWGGCMVDRGAKYHDLVGKLRVAHPRFVAQIEWEQALTERRAQVERNMRLNGIH